MGGGGAEGEEETDRKRVNIAGVKKKKSMTRILKMLAVEANMSEKKIRLTGESKRLMNRRCSM